MLIIVLNVVALIAFVGLLVVNKFFIPGEGMLAIIIGIVEGIVSVAIPCLIFRYERENHILITSELALNQETLLTITLYLIAFALWFVCLYGFYAILHRIYSPLLVAYSVINAILMYWLLIVSVLDLFGIDVMTKAEPFINMLTAPIYGDDARVSLCFWIWLMLVPLFKALLIFRMGKRIGAYTAGRISLGAAEVYLTVTFIVITIMVIIARTYSRETRRILLFPEAWHY